MSIGFGDPNNKTNLLLTAYVVGPFSLIIIALFLWHNAVGYGIDKNPTRIIYFIISYSLSIYSTWRILSSLRKLTETKKSD
jgi:hypothetical protein